MVNWLVVVMLWGLVESMWCLAGVCERGGVKGRTEDVFVLNFLSFLLLILRRGGLYTSCLLW